MAGWMRGGVDGWAQSGVLACNVCAGTLIFEENERSKMYMRYRKVLYCLRRTLIFESRLWEIEMRCPKVLYCVRRTLRIHRGAHEIDMSH